VINKLIQLFVYRWAERSDAVVAYIYIDYCLGVGPKTVTLGHDQARAGMVKMSCPLLVDMTLTFVHSQCRAKAVCHVELWLNLGVLVRIFLKTS
jgi:hypothetical protein